MKNIIDYVTGADDYFRNKEFTVVDSLVLSQLSYLRFDGLVQGLSNPTKPVSIGGIANAETIESMINGVRDGESNRKLLHALAGSPRFRDVKLIFYVNKIDLNEEKQFSAVTCLLDDGTAYIAYRGTDSTFVGWKEDFNMAFMSPVPSQKEGAEYLNAVADLIQCDLIIGGHSKGGNIAVYSAIKCRQPVKSRITRVFSHDGPGFKDEIFLNYEYLSMKDRINKTLPQSAVIGMLLQQQEDYSVVKSNRIGIMQHDPFSWLVEKGDFIYVQTVKNSALFMNAVLNKWIGALDESKRELFFDTLYQVIKATGANTFADLTNDRKNRAFAALEAIKGIDAETKAFVLKTIRSIFVLSVKNIQDIRLKISAPKR